MSSWDLGNNQHLGLIEQADAATRRKAAVRVCGMAGTAADARPVLEALGLVEPLTPSPQGRRQR